MTPYVLQILSCSTGQENNLHKIQLCKVLDIVHHDSFVSWTVMSQAVNIFSACVPTCLIAALEEGNLFFAIYEYVF